MKTYNQLCADIGFNKMASDMPMHIMAVMAVCGAILRNSKFYRDLIERAEIDLDLSGLFSEATSIVNITTDDLAIIKSSLLEFREGMVFFPEVNEWIKKNNANKPAIQSHVLLSHVTPEKYKKDDETLYKNLYIAKQIHNRVTKAFPKANIGSAKALAWAEHIDKLHRIDGHSYDFIWDIFKWAHKDEFWRAQILSTANLRDKWSQLVVKAQVQKEKEQPVKEKLKTSKMNDIER